MKTILCSQYPHLKKDKAYRQFADTFILPEQNIIEIETISQVEFKKKSKFLVFNVGMGGGKTYQTIEYLKQCPNFSWICPNKALSYNTLTRLEDVKVDVKHYLSFTTEQKKNGSLDECNKLIVVLNSLHYCSKISPDVVIIDEIETLLDKFLGDFIENKQEIWNNFVRILTCAKKVILLDAFITTKTINFINNLTTPRVEKPLTIFKRINEPYTRTIKYMTGKEIMTLDIIQKLKNGSKVFIFYPHKNQSGFNISMETLFNMLTKESGQKGVFYHADVGEKTKKGLKNVNEAWSDYKFVLTNSVITCGINYENEDFDYAYIFTASFNSPRDIIQVSYRARFLSTGIINVCFLGSMNQINTWKVDNMAVNDVKYDNLIESILIEKKSPIKQTLQLFCSKAHYKQEVNDKTITTELEKYFKDLVDANINLGYSFSSIKDIEQYDADIITQRIFSQEATMYEKIRLKKFYFKKQFIESAYDEKLKLCEMFEVNYLQQIWDENYCFFSNNLKC